jgi:hypothetical protein
MNIILHIVQRMEQHKLQLATDVRCEEMYVGC